MRKYVQLLLIVATVTSVFLMLLYERKYSKVKMILEALNGFSYQEATSKPRPSLKPTHEPYFTSNPSWIYVIDSLYLYASYWHNASESEAGETLVLATSDSIPNSRDLQCYLWYKDRHEALVGDAKVIKYASDPSDFLISCSNVHHSLVPYGITVSYKSTNSSFINVNAVGEHFPMAVCLETLPEAFQDPVLLAEFLIFYRNVGVNYFVIYEEGMSPITRRFLEHGKKIGYQLDILHWNYPRKDTGKTAQILNCFARSFLVHRVNTVATLKLGQFLVPKSASNLVDVIEKSGGASSYKFNTYHFCSEYPLDIVAKTLHFPFLSLKYMKRLNKEETSDVLAYRNVAVPWDNQEKSEKTQLISGRDVMVHVYGKCHLPQDHLNANYNEDTTMMNYKDTFFSSPLFQYLEKMNKT